MDELTARQREVYDFMVAYYRERGFAPTRMEISANFGWRSDNAAQGHIDALVRKGWVDKMPGTARAMIPLAPNGRRFRIG